MTQDISFTDPPYQVTDKQADHLPPRRCWECGVFIPRAGWGYESAGLFGEEIRLWAYCTCPHCGVHLSMEVK